VLKKGVAAGFTRHIRGVINVRWWDKPAAMHEPGNDLDGVTATVPPVGDKR